jgi:hypothetical protein
VLLTLPSWLCPDCVVLRNSLILDYDICGILPEQSGGRREGTPIVEEVLRRLWIRMSLGELPVSYAKEFVRSVLVAIVFQGSSTAWQNFARNGPKRFPTCVKCVTNEPDRNNRFT